MQRPSKKKETKNTGKSEKNYMDNDWWSVLVKQDRNCYAVKKRLNLRSC